MFGALLLAGGALYIGIKSYRKLKHKSWSFPLDEWPESSKEKSPAKNSLLPTITDNDENLAVPTASLGLATAGALFFPPLQLACIPTLLYLGLPQFKSAYRALTHEGRLNRAAPESLITGLCLLNGFYFAPALGFWLTRLNRKLVRTTEEEARQQLVRSLGELPRSTWIVQDGVEIEVPYTTLKTGEQIVVEAGQIIPVDGIICEGCALVDQFRLTRQPRPVSKEIGETVLASTVVLAGRILIRVEKSGPETAVAQLAQILQQAGATPLERQTQSKAVADEMALPMIGLGALTSVLISPAGAAAVMNSRLGYDLDLVAPTVLLSFLNVAIQDGIFIKDPAAIERLQQVDTLLLDYPLSQRSEITQVIRRLRRQRIDYVYILLNEEKTLSRRQLMELDADGAFNAIHPQQQMQIVEQLQTEGRSVCYVGDGLRDRGAVRQANVAISLRGFANLVENPAQVVLLEGNFNRLGQLFEMAYEFDASLGTTLKAAYTPGLVNMASSLILSSGVTISILLNSFSLYAGIGSAISPIMKYERARFQEFIEFLRSYAQFQAAAETASKPQTTTGTGIHSGQAPVEFQPV